MINKKQLKNLQATVGVSSSQATVRVSSSQIRKLKRAAFVGRSLSKEKIIRNRKRPTISLKLSLLVLSIVFTLYLAVTSLLFIDFFTDILTLPSALSLQCAAIPLLVYDNTENQRKEII